MPQSNYYILALVFLPDPIVKNNKGQHEYISRKQSRLGSNVLMLSVD